MIAAELLFWLAAATAAFWAGAAAWISAGMASIPALASEPAPALADPPHVSIVVAARDEAAAVEGAIRSLLDQDYPSFDLTVVDDRSTDGTGAILDRLADEDERLRVLHHAELPPGWLGKNYALHEGARAAQGEIILFADADVLMAPTALARAVAMLQRQGLDHLAVVPELTVGGYWARAFVGFFWLCLVFYARPWRARHRRSRAHLGIGAFTLVRAAAYREVGGHARLRMRPDDDLALARVLKRAGFRQDVALGQELITVAWYPDLRATIRGLEKNAFAAVNYSLVPVLASVAGLLVVFVWPWVAIVGTTGPTRVLNLAAVAAMVLAWMACRPATGAGLRFAAAMPAVALLFAYTVLRSAVLTLRQGGIRWRGTLYPLAELRANRV